MSNKDRNNNQNVLIVMMIAVAIMIIVSISYSFSGGKGTYGATSSVFDNCLFLGDSRYALLTSEIQSIGNNVAVRAVSGSKVSDWKNVVANGSGVVGSGASYATNITLPSSASCVSVMLGANSPDQISSMKELMVSLHNRYPNAKIVFNSIYHLGSNWVYGYEASRRANTSYDNFNEELESFSASNSSWAGYADITEGLHDANGFLKYPDSEGIHLSSAGIPIFIQNIKTEVGRVISPSEPSSSSSSSSSSSRPSSSSSSQPSSNPENNNAPYDDIIDGDRCYDGKWVRILTCQAATVSGAKCKLIDGTIIDRGSGALTTEGCSDPPIAYTETVAAYKCDMENDNWVYILSCQPEEIIGAKCKTKDNSTVVRTNLKNDNACTGTKPGTKPSNSSEEVIDIPDNPYTGTIGFIIWFIIGFIALIISGYYFRKNKILNDK